MITTKDYLERTQELLDAKWYTDGCTSPFKTYIHRWLKKSHLLCAAHDYGNLKYISGVRPGLHNQLHTLIAHFSQPNPIYWLWGIVVSIATLPWIVWRRDLGITFFPMGAFHAFFGMIGLVTYLIKTYS